MKCPQCKSEITDDSKYCENCGNKIKIGERDIHMLSSQIVSHLEFLGFEIDPVKITEQNDELLAKHDQRSNLRIIVNIKQGISVVSYYTLNHKKVVEDKNKFLELLNEINIAAVMCCFSYSFNSEVLFCASWYPPEYSKQSFAAFIERHEAEITMKFLRDERMQKYS